VTKQKGPSWRPSDVNVFIGSCVAVLDAWKNIINKKAAQEGGLKLIKKFF
jgi:hypothetical protein